MAGRRGRRESSPGRLDLRVHDATLGNNVTGEADGLDGLAVGGLAVLDLEGILLGGQEAQLSRDDHQIVSGGGAVLPERVSYVDSWEVLIRSSTYQGTLGVGGNVKVVHVQTAGHDNAHAGDLIERDLAAGISVS